MFFFRHVVRLPTLYLRHARDHVPHSSNFEFRTDPDSQTRRANRIFRRRIPVHHCFCRSSFKSHPKQAGVESHHTHKTDQNCRADGGGHWGILETPKTEEKFIQNRKIANKIGQNRKPHTKLYTQIGPNREKNRKTTLGTKTEKPLLFFTKTENQMLKNEKSANRIEHHNRKTDVF